MNVSEFINQVVYKDFAFQSRIIEIPQAKELLELCNGLSHDNRFKQIRIGDFINQNTYLPPPEALFGLVEEKIQQELQSDNVSSLNTIFYVTGVNGLLRLWNSEMCNHAYCCMKLLLDSLDFCIWIFIDEFDSNKDVVFHNPRYVDCKQLLTIRDSSIPVDSPKQICLVNKNYLSKFNGNRFGSLKQALKEFGAGTVSSSDNECQSYIGVDFIGSRLAGISDLVKQASSLRDFFKLKYNISEELSDAALEWLYAEFEKSYNNTTDVLGIIRNRFFPNGVKDSADKLPNLIRTSDETEKELLFWGLRKSADPELYLSAVLQNPNVDYSNFTLYYVCQPIEFFNSQLTSDQLDSFTQERKRGIEVIGVDLLGSEISQFIENAKSFSFDKVVPWLNNNSKEEKCEIIRRFVEMEQTSVPISALRVYPQLNMYLKAYSFPNPELNSYFSDYRTLKVKNSITEEFCQRAANIVYPPRLGLNYRDAELQNYSLDNSVGLIIVDALGAEYIPMLLALANERNIGVEKSEVCICKIPSSTAFNPIKWNQDRIYDQIKSHDNTIHDGEEKHVSSPFENNFVALLDRLSKNVMPKVSNALEKFDRVILTSDHGSTRLAVNAYNNSMSNTLPVKSTSSFDDWRYTSVNSVESIPEGTTTSTDGKWCVVKGYNRFAKQGAKHNECHGGLTLEEILVPFIVFRKGAQFQPANSAQQQAISSNEELTENGDFDEL